MAGRDLPEGRPQLVRDRLVDPPRRLGHLSQHGLGAGEIGMGEQLVGRRDPD